MSDLRALLHEAAPTTTDAATTATIVDADVVRAHRALRRRRASRLSAGTGLVAAAALGAVVIVGSGNGPFGSPDPTTAAPRSGVQAVELVAYTGAQPAGYTLDRVPAGWSVRDSTPSALVLAPRGASPAASDGVTSFEGVIAVMTSSEGVPDGVRLDQVRVGDQPAVIAHMKGSGDTRTLFVRLPSGVHLVIQVWDGLGWDNERIADFASSVHVTKDAKPTVG